jgi:hypothetical protein
MDWYDSFSPAMLDSICLFVVSILSKMLFPILSKNSIKKRNESSSGLSLKYRMMRDAKARFLPPLDYCVVLLIIGSLTILLILVYLIFYIEKLYCNNNTSIFEDVN